MRLLLVVATVAMAAGCGGSPTAPGALEPYGWQPDDLLVETTGASLGQEAPRTALSADGAAAVAWLHDQVGDARWLDQRAWVSLRRPPLKWSPPELIDERGHVHSVDVAMTRDGSLVAVWSREEEGGVSVWARRRDPTAGWTPAERLTAAEPLAPYVVRLPVRVRAGADGVLAVWVAGGRRLTARRYRPGAGWEQPIVAEVEQHAVPRLLTDGAANFVVLCPGRSLISYTLRSTDTQWSRRQVFEDAWNVSDLSEYERNYDAALAADGTGWLVYSDASRRLVGRRHNDAGGWGQPEVVAEPAVGIGHTPRLGVANGGRAVVVWGEARGFRIFMWRAWATRFDGRWETPRALHDGELTSLREPLVLTTRDGGFLLWRAPGDAGLLMFAVHLDATLAFGPVEVAPAPGEDPLGAAGNERGDVLLAFRGYKRGVRAAHETLGVRRYVPKR